MVDAAPTSGRALRFSVVTAVYNVELYLDAYIASMDGQTFPAEDFEIIVVDDGSTDGSLAVLREWQRRRPGLITVLTKENGGQSTARNMGMEVARGEWITFPDPDDVLEPDYLSEVDTFLRENPETLMVGTSRHMLNDTTGELTDTHPLRAHFGDGNRLRNLDEWPKYFHGSAPAAFFRAETVREQGLRFDAQVRPNFEDGHFCCRYVLAAEAPLVGFVATAKYHYRKRQNSSSTLQTSLTDPDRYTKVLRNGYLALLRSSSAETGSAPEWLQNYVLYELSWYLSSQDNASGAVSAATGLVAEEFHALLGEIVQHLDDDLIASFDLRSMKRIWKEILLHSYAEEPWHNPFAVVSAADHDQGLVKLSYHFTGELPREEFLVRGKPVAPRHAKIRDINYHGRVLLHERIVWVPLQLLRMKLDGRYVDLRFSAPGFPTHALRASDVRKKFAPAAGIPTARKKPARRATRRTLSVEDRLVVRLAGSAPVRQLFQDAWVLMDRIHDADDSAELLFRHLQRHRPDINSWFVIESGTPDWERLRGEGYRNVVAHGSFRWKLLMANCAHLISSHADVPVLRPPAILRFMQPAWRFTFLQHGVIKDDLSQWLNGKKIDLFVTSTPAEQESIAGDHTPYAFTTREAKLTGLPRFDRLREQGELIGPDERDLLLIAPTWRDWLVPPLAAGTQRRSVNVPEFLETDYARNWLALLNSPELAEAAELQGLTVAFLPHPNLQSILSGIELPPHVLPLTFVGNDVQRLFARASLLVTDYSSMAFNAAYIDRPSVYFQFDSDRMGTGSHVGRQGYFDYARDGFGPVTYELEDAVRAIVESVKNGPVPAPEYAARIDATFPMRDGRCCERVVTEIEQLTRRSRPKAPAKRAATHLAGRAARRVVRTVGAARRRGAERAGVGA
ncbi:bifunctional glycosyltransferase/CDP-glycerol:glycerophosphate glycerophosphotransferase [Blastococcus goldschmidtiae]|uniref:CDP-glycerol glycerophosphotransferase family protein n=1 Tax=Blastococcus goldschmidtiae TaxID=3075546 RepID=A0ABU2K4C2_9ACTN|nr:glycosyltransferase [Blastococcus sp. DSM 46792]MDT0275019.1 CDP-glycerol glycerophosphotransferase family protein [Blastococcus sp. DSM 46792]